MCLDVNCPDRTMSLIDAIKWQNYERADQLIMNRHYLDKTDWFGRTPLMLLLLKLPKHKICLEFITKLIDAGADVNIKDNDGRTALIYAVKRCGGYSLIDAVKMLIEA